MIDAHVFDHRTDDLERTDWLLFSRYLPERIGTYEICAWKGADVTRCRWDGEQWWATDRLAHHLSAGYWRGITRKAYVKASKSLWQGSAATEA